ncbi:MAG TPA: hypothetical protein PK402_04560 [Tepidisphaeraceae bacterium]|nr:hypothetical protein [Tepidisphaeraceae bacterium]
MQNAPALHLAQHEVRREICTMCPWRTGGDLQCPGSPRACERSCTVFLHLPELMEVANQVDPIVGSPHRALDRYVDQVVTHGDNSADVHRLCYHKDQLLRVIDDLESDW